MIELQYKARMALMSRNNVTYGPNCREGKNVFMVTMSITDRISENEPNEQLSRMEG